MIQPLVTLADDQLLEINSRTLDAYEERSEQFWIGTRQHDVGQNIEALLRNIRSDPPFEILDFGCGPGRDLLKFSELGHHPTGIDGCAAFVKMAKSYSNCDVFEQNFLRLELPNDFFDGIFANASIFHVPTQELTRVLQQLYCCLKPGGVLFCSNPRGSDIERFIDNRYGVFMRWKTWRSYPLNVGFSELEHYYRPQKLPRNQQPWLASLWRRPN